MNFLNVFVSQDYTISTIFSQIHYNCPKNRYFWSVWAKMVLIFDFSLKNTGVFKCMYPRGQIAKIQLHFNALKYSPPATYFGLTFWRSLHRKANQKFGYLKELNMSFCKRYEQTNNSLHNIGSINFWTLSNSWACFL